MLLGPVEGPAGLVGPPALPLLVLGGPELTPLFRMLPAQLGTPPGRGSPQLPLLPGQQLRPLRVLPSPELLLGSRGSWRLIGL